MAIRMTGMVSGLDTESIIQSLVEAQQTKNKKTTDKKQKLEWKQEIWKELNTKLYNFTTNTISKMRLQSSYGTKKVSNSNESKVKVTASSSAPLGSQTLQISQLAKSGYMTGTKITTKSGGTVTSTTKLSEMGIEDGSVISVTSGEKTSDITLTSDMTISDLTKKMKEAGVNVSFDSSQKRFYVSSKNSGKANDFSLSAADKNGVAALEKLGMMTSGLTDAQKAEYTPWADAAAATDDDGIFANILANDDLKAVYDEKVKDLTSKYTKQVETKTEELNTLTTAKDELQSQLDELNAIDLDDADTWSSFQLDHAEEMFEVQEAYDALTDDEKAATSLEEMKRQKADEILEKEKQDKQTELDTQTDAIAAKQAEIDEINNNKLNGTDGNEGVQEEVKTALIERAKLAKEIIANDSIAGSNYKGKYATKIDGQDAIFTLNDVEYTANTNETTVNGVTLTLSGVTEPAETISFSVTNDVDGVYDMVKSFVKEYNDILDELNKLYYADSAKGYDPLTDDQKDAMSEKEIEKWEQKIKDSLLRRDDTISGITSTMRNSLLGTVEYNGKKYSLSSFGIVTSSDYTEKGKLHIKGDADDSTYSSDTNKLKAALEENPDAVMSVLSDIMGNLYSNMQDKMKKTSMSSALTFYNDTYMKNQLNDLNKQIKKDETRLTEMEDKYYKQFSAMEVAMQKMQQQSSYLSSLMGN